MSSARALCLEPQEPMIGDNRMKEKIRIYVACLAAYNNGALHGDWIDATQGLEGINEDVQKMLIASPIEHAEEWTILDYEGFGSYRLSEYESFETVSEIAEFLEAYGEVGSELLGHFSSVIEARKAIEECYAGEYKSLADFAEEITTGTTCIPDNLSLYIDFERMGKDMELSGDIFVIETAHDQVHLFYNC